MSTAPFNVRNYFLSERALGEFGERAALEFRGVDVTYSQLAAEVDRWAGFISSSGIDQGDHVALLLFDSPEFVAAFLATLRLGAVAVPINTYLSADDVRFIIADSGARLLIEESDLMSALGPDHKMARIIVDTVARSTKAESGLKPGGAPVVTTRESPAFLLYTSGSTGKPKGVLHVQGSIPVTVENYARNVLNLSSDDRVYSASKLFFAYGLGNSLSFPLGVGATTILNPDRPAPESVARILEDGRPTVFFGVPSLYNSLLELDAAGRHVDTSSLRLCISAGEALPIPVFEEWRLRFGLSILDGIGSTEMLHIFISNRGEDPRAGSSGQPVPGYEVRLVDDVLNEVAVDEPGHLWVRGASGTAGYWNRPDLTAETVRDGWVRTGDVYTRDAGGFFHHVGRSDDCFKVSGLWVSPVEVESVLTEHQAVSEAAVVSSIDRHGLATGKAFIVIRQGVDAATIKRELIEFVAEKLPRYKVPSTIEIIDRLPRTATGKVQRFILRSD